MPSSFFIVTPSFNQLAYLKRCVASVRDQAAPGLEIRHLVIDGASSDGTVEWLRSEGVEHISEPDSGMYDALNKGLLALRECSSEEMVFSWLNCDEQYLPGALMSVSHCLQGNCTADIICGDALLVEPDGGLLTYWKSLPLRQTYLRIGTLYNMTCAMFFRKRVLGGDLWFNRNLKAIADVCFVQDLLRAGASSRCLGQYLAAYTFFPSNISNQPFASKEKSELEARSPVFARWAARFFRIVERAIKGTRRQVFPLEYRLIDDKDLKRRLYVSGYVPGRWPQLRKS